MKYFIIAGEASGDLHGAHLAKEIFLLDPTAEMLGMGGDLMKKEGVQLAVDYSAYSFMGFVEVIRNLGKIKRLIKTIKKKITAFNPDKIILIDYGGFNLKIAKFCKERGIETHFYILPKVWAWNEKRVIKIRKYVDFGYCIFPFEEAYFTGHDVNASYVGNPVVEQILAFKKLHPTVAKKDQIALLPGSRAQEVSRIMPTMLQYAKTRPEIHFVVAAHNKNLFADFTFPPNVTFSTSGTYTTVYESKAAVVTSGTANLETALLGCPQVVCYKANGLSYMIGKRLVKIKYISPVNLILDKLVIQELIQADFNVVHLDKEVAELLKPEQAELIGKDYLKLWDVLSKKSAAKETAIKIIES